MMYRLKIAPPARRGLKKIQTLYEEEVALAIEELKEDPFTGKELVDELRGKWAYKIDVYRIIYIVNKVDKIITIISARHRSISYQ